VFITGVAFVASLLFFVQGFVSTFSLMHNKPEGEDVTFGEAFTFFLKRVVRFTPFNMFIIGFGACIGPLMGGGPYWDLYQKTYAPCTQYWWTNLFFINNLYPSAFDEKCMGWTWILSCYMQLTLLLPFLLLVFTKLPRALSSIVYGVLIVGTLGLNMWLILDKETGLIGRFDREYFLNNAFLE
jgi:peptidoglycan/LPS O-acetylase OafA/YrhL